MREQTKDNITLLYPEELGFAFNTCLLIASGERLERIGVTITGEDKKERVFFDSLNGKCYGDIKEYVQTFFDTLSFGKIGYEEKEKTKMGMLLSFEIVAIKDNQNSVAFNFDVYYIWGALKLGGKEIYNDYRTLTWFRGYPFTFGIYAAGNSSLLLSKDGVADSFVEIPEQGVWNVPLTLLDNAQNYYDIDACLGTFTAVTFDRSFDLTFQYRFDGTQTKKLRVNIVDACVDGGVYLRWINRHGFYCYYLFKRGEEQIKTTTDNLFVRNNLLTYDEAYGYQGYTGRQQQMKREDVVSLCAPLVDSETWDMLFDIATSPCVDMFAGYKDGEGAKWLSVTVVAGSYTKTGAVLQDFICNIQLSDVNIQKL